jgi:hypothetical protein
MLLGFSVIGIALAGEQRRPFDAAPCDPRPILAGNGSLFYFDSLNPISLAATLAAEPSMSLAPLAPFYFLISTSPFLGGGFGFAF